MNDKDTHRPPLGSPLESRLRQLAEEGIEPKRDLWPDLEKRLLRRNRDRRSRLRLQLAAAVVLVLCLAGGAWWALRGPSGTMLDDFVTLRSQEDLPRSSSEGLRASFASYLTEREHLLELLARELEGYPPEVQRNVLENIEVIENAMSEIERSISGEHGEPEAEVRLAQLYERELRLLAVVNARLRGSPGHRVTRQGGTDG